MREYLLIFLTALAVTYLLAVIARELAMRTGAFARVRDRDVHEIPIPYFGGVAMMAGVVAAFLVATQLPFLSSSPSHERIFSDARAIIIGGALICLVGVIDDIFELDAITKFAGEALAAGVVVVQGVQILWLPLPGDRALSMFSLGGSQAAFLTIVLIIATVNAVNFVDGLDGLAAGVVAIGALAFFTFSYLVVFINHQERATTAAMLTAALAGACIGFLPHNFFPARMFMGDSGALLIGFLLACSTISLTGQFSNATIDEGVAGASASLLPALLPLAIERWLDVATTLDVHGFYLVIGRRTPYPAAWDRASLGNLLRIIYRLRILNEYRVVVGYADTGGLPAIAVGADAIASGWNYRQRHFLSERWVPHDGGQAPVPRVTSAPLMSALLGLGEMDAAARSPVGPEVLPDAVLRERISRRPDSWPNPQAVVQHLEVLGRVVADLEAAGDAPARLDRLAEMTREARRLLVDLARNGVRVNPVHNTALVSLAAASADARAAEGI